MIFFDPLSPAMKERELLEGRQPGSLSGLAQHNIEDLRRFCRELGLNSLFAQQHCQVKKLKYFAGVNAIIADNKVAFIHYYGRGTRGFDSPAMYITAPEVLKFFASEFAVMWSDADPLDLVTSP